MTAAQIRRLFTTWRALNIAPPFQSSFWTRPKVQWTAYSSKPIVTIYDFRFAMAIQNQSHKIQNYTRQQNSD